jgi:hypothetical protein
MKTRMATAVLCMPQRAVLLIDVYEAPGTDALLFQVHYETRERKLSRTEIAWWKEGQLRIDEKEWSEVEALINETAGTDA